METTILIGLGAGQCGFNALKELLNRQPQVSVSIENAPLLPWECDDSVRRIRERLNRFRSMGNGLRVVSDIAAFYLPYAEWLLSNEPSVRMLCLRAPIDRVVSGFEQQLDSISRVRTNNWSEVVPPGWYRDPLWSRTFPKYKVHSRTEALEQYYIEYYQAVDQLAQKYSQNFKVIDAKELSNESTVRDVLDFANIPSALQNLWVCPSEKVFDPPSKPRLYNDDRLDPRKCVVLVPFGMFIHQECDQALKELERRGYEVRRVGGYAAIDQGRNQMATDALLDGFEETLWIDSDVGFHPDDVDRLRRHNLPIVCGIYPQKGKRALACHVAPGMPSVTFGKDGGLIEILYAGAGFLLVRREAYYKVQYDLNLPVCNERFGAPMIPFFHPMIREIEDAHWYLAEDYAFCERARRCGIPTFADTAVRLWHVGYYRYGWEDAGMDRPRFSSFTMSFRDAPSTRSETSHDDIQKIANLAARYPWPENQPETGVVDNGIWMLPSVRQALSDTIKVDHHCILEIGCWIGRSSRFIAELAGNSSVICLDQWNEDESSGDSMDRVFDSFRHECWEMRHRLITMRREIMEGLREVADCGICPDVIFFNSSSEDPLFPQYLTAALDLFPSSILLGHCFDKPEVNALLENLRVERRLRLDSLSTAWRIGPRK